MFIRYVEFLTGNTKYLVEMNESTGTDLGISATSLLLILFMTQVVAAPFAIL